MAIWNERIRTKRIQKGITLAQIANKLGVTEATAQRYESGSIKSIPYEHMCAYGEILGCSPAYLMGWEPEQDPSFSFYLDQQLNLMGYSILYDSNGNVTLYHDSDKYEITDIDVKDLRSSVKSYVKFKLNEIMSHSKKIETTLPNAAHARTDIDMPEDTDTSDDDIMDDENF